MDAQTQLELEAAAFRTLRDHLQKRTAGFCRNCLSRWYQEAAAERGIEIGKMEAREAFYGMPFDEWKAKHQTEASDAQKAAFKIAHDDER